ASLRGSRQAPCGDRTGSFVQCCLQAQGGKECPDPPWYDYGANRQAQARLALTRALAALPAADGFFGFDDLERALFDRIGEHLSLGHIQARPYTWGRGANDAASEEAAWFAKLREAWRGRERLWIRRALVTWAYALGI